MARPVTGPAPQLRTLFRGRSAVQDIKLALLPGRGLSLLLDGAWQFTEATEHRYHEALVVVPLTIRRPRTVLIGGGGDGLAAARLLRYPEVEFGIPPLMGRSPMPPERAADPPVLLGAAEWPRRLGSAMAG